MEFVTLGDSGLRVSRLCLGTMPFSTTGKHPYMPGADSAAARTVIDAFCADGHNFIDTADAYGEGESERVVGQAIRHRRDRIVLATKAGGPSGPDRAPTSLSRRHLTAALHASLRRLDTDYIDLYQCHRWDPDTPIDETMATLDDFVRAGKVRYIGCSNFTAAQIVESQWAAERRHATRFISLQPQYSLLSRAVETEVLPTAARHGLGGIVYSPLGSGVLAGRYRRGEAPGADTRMGKLAALANPAAKAWTGQLLSERSHDVVDTVGRIAAELGCGNAAVALAWVLARPHVTAAIAGARDLTQYRELAAGVELRLPADAIRRLDEVSAVDAVVANGEPQAARAQPAVRGA